MMLKAVVSLVSNYSIKCSELKKLSVTVKQKKKKKKNIWHKLEFAVLTMTILEEKCGGFITIHNTTWKILCVHDLNLTFSCFQMRFLLEQ